MSKRFGRNQKRALQNEVNRLRQANTVAAGLQRQTTQELQRAREALHIIYHEIGKNLSPYHPLLPADVRKQFAVASADVYSVRLPMDRMVVKTVEVLRRRFLTDEYQQQVAVKLMHGETCVGYAVSAKALHAALFRQEFINDLAADIAEKLTEAIQCRG